MPVLEDKSVEIIYTGKKIKGFKWTEPQGPVGKQQKGTFVLLKSPKRKGEEFGAVKIFEETKAENFPCLLLIPAAQWNPTG